MRLDIRPSFLVSALQQSAPVQKGVRKMVEIAAHLSFGELINHEGVHLEKIKGLVRGCAKITCAVQVILLRPLMSVRHRIGQYILSQRRTRDGKPQYTLRVTRAARAIATVDGDILVLLFVEPDHEKAYR